MAHTIWLNNCDTSVLAVLLSLSLFAIWPFGGKKAASAANEIAVSDSTQDETPASWAIAINTALLGRYDDAIGRFQAMAQDDPQNPALHYNLGLCHLELKDYVSAAESFERVIELAPDRADAFGNLGAALHALGKYEDACAAYRQALQLKPGEPSFYYGWGCALMSKESLPEAAEMLGYAHNAEPDEPTYCFNFGLCLAKLERVNDAVNVLAHFLNISKGRFPHQESWAREYLDQNQLG